MNEITDKESRMPLSKTDSYKSIIHVHTACSLHVPPSMPHT